MAKAAKDKKTPEKAKALFILALTQNPNVTAAADLARINHSTAYRWKNEDKKFAEAWENALERSTDSLEQEAIRRAREGVVRMKFHEGRAITIAGPDGKTQIPYLEREYSDTLLIFLLKAHRPKKYRDNTIALVGGDAKAEPISIRVVTDAAVIPEVSK